MPKTNAEVNPPADVVRPNEIKTGETQGVYLTTDNPTVGAVLLQNPAYRPVPADKPVTGDETNKLFLLTDSFDAVTESGLQTPEEDRKEDETPKQNSVITVFTIWNTMMGTSILAIPWALAQAGFGFGIFLILFVAGIATYTAFLAERTTEDLRTIKNLPNHVFLEFADAVHHHFGKPGRIISLLFSQVSILGASIVYYVLLSNFLYYTGEYIYYSATKQFPKPPVIPYEGRNFTDVLCNLKEINGTMSESTKNEIFSKIWNIQLTVPAWLLIIIFPLISIKSPTFLGKFTALATISVIYLFILIGIKGYGWKVNMKTDLVTGSVEQYRDLFASLTGTCSMAFYIHNALQTILRSHRSPKRNPQVIMIAFGFTTLTYLLIGSMFFIIFPVSKRCIMDNLLNNLVTDIPVFVGRLALLFQMTTVYPMIVYILRAQFMYAVFGNIYPSWKHVLVLHLVVVGLGLLFAIVYPQIGTIIRFIGALCGLVYIFTLPPLITLLNKRILGHETLISNTLIDESGVKELTKANSLLSITDDQTVSKMWRNRRTQVLWWVRCGFYIVIMLLGLLNFIFQFVLLAIPTE